MILYFPSFYVCLAYCKRCNYTCGHELRGSQTVVGHGHRLSPEARAAGSSGVGAGQSLGTEVLQLSCGGHVTTVSCELSASPGSHSFTGTLSGVSKDLVYGPQCSCLGATSGGCQPPLGQGLLNLQSQFPLWGCLE